MFESTCMLLLAFEKQHCFTTEAAACDGVGSAAFGLGALHLGRLETIASIASSGFCQSPGLPQVSKRLQYPRKGMSSGSMLKNLEIAWFGKMQFHSDVASFVNCYYQTSPIKIFLYSFVQLQLGNRCRHPGTADVGRAVVFLFKKSSAMQHRTRS